MHAMRDDTPLLRVAPFRRAPTDGWVGTLEYPGYRAGDVVAKLGHLPEVDPDHLYFDLLLLDSRGRTRDNHSGPCTAIGRTKPLEERSRFVRLVAELVRHVPDEIDDLSPIHPALTLLRQRGVGLEALVAAAQCLDEVGSEHAVVASLADLLSLYLGDEEACHTLADVVAGLARRRGASSLDAVAPFATGVPDDVGTRVRELNQRGLAAQLTYVVRTVGKARARHYLRDVTDFDMVPGPDMFGV
jgi:hypothetical protein